VGRPTARPEAPGRDAPRELPREIGREVPREIAREPAAAERAERSPRETHGDVLPLSSAVRGPSPAKRRA
jgi:hypothetical protein